MQIAQANSIDPALIPRTAVLGSGTLDSLPHNGAVVTLLAVGGSTHRKSYLDMVMAQHRRTDPRLGRLHRPGVVAGVLLDWAF
jgi:hypothetical protein